MQLLQVVVQVFLPYDSVKSMSIKMPVGRWTHCMNPMAGPNRRIIAHSSRFLEQSNAFFRKYFLDIFVLNLGIELDLNLLSHGEFCKITLFFWLSVTDDF